MHNGNEHNLPARRAIGYEKSSGACDLWGLPAATFGELGAPCCDFLRYTAIQPKSTYPVHIPGFLVDNVHSNSQLPTQAFSRFSKVDSVRARAYESKQNISCIS